MSSLEPVAYRVRCGAWDCDPERPRPKSQPITLQGTKTQVVRELGRLGWAKAPGPGSWWWCPQHAPFARANPVPLDRSHTG